ncbi:hypothetical protein OC846_005066 [Tilletia horrida]|uniref:Uncharacterized protein n=1 Tax=Tilletia horrida TaxID=155126 RepID=A0AAN6JWD1_9BASI|nr:hypothetical protein OC846_005066 [Tilletia horrida]KAK0562541.1 hypothetical protein OC861_005268 [Tilletia horrida]
MAFSSPVRIQSGAAANGGITLTPETARNMTASPGGNFYGSTPGGSRIVYSREQMMSLASSPLVKAPLQLRNGAQGIPPEIARRAGAGADSLQGSPEKSSMRGMAMLKSAAQQQQQRGEMRSPSGRVTMGDRRSPYDSRRVSGKTITGRRSRKASHAGREADEADATVTTSDVENDSPLSGSGADLRLRLGGGTGKGLHSGDDDQALKSLSGKLGMLSTASKRDEEDQRRGRDRSPRISLGTLGGGTAGGPLLSNLVGQDDDPFGGGGAAGAADGHLGVFDYLSAAGGRRGSAQEAADVLAEVTKGSQLGGGSGAAQTSFVGELGGLGGGSSAHRRGLSSSTASSLASGPPSKRSSIGADALFVMEL